MSAGTPVFRARAPVTLVGGGPVPATALREALAVAPVPVAADGGAAALLAEGIRPEAVYGDLDSLSPADAADLEGRTVHLRDQDTTDLQKCLAAIRAPLILGIGFLGGRLDHTLSALGTLMAEGDRPVVLLGEGDIAMHLGAPLSIDLPAGARVSLMPLAPVRVISEGLRWETGGLTLAPGGRDGCSNEALGRVSLAPEGPGAILVLEAARTGALLGATGAGAPSRFVRTELR